MPDSSRRILYLHVLRQCTGSPNCFHCLTLLDPTTRNVLVQYHSHDSGQYPDGLHGPLIVHYPLNPYRGKIDGEIVTTVSDWYHD